MVYTIDGNDKVRGGLQKVISIFQMAVEDKKKLNSSIRTPDDGLR